MPDRYCDNKTCHWYIINNSDDQTFAGKLQVCQGISKLLLNSACKGNELCTCVNIVYVQFFFYNCLFINRPDMTSAVDWALKANYLSIYPFITMCCSKCSTSRYDKVALSGSILRSKKYLAMNWHFNIAVVSKFVSNIYSGVPLFRLSILRNVDQCFIFKKLWFPIVFI